MELTKDELDLIALSNIQAHQTLDGQATLRSSRHEIGGLSEILCCQYYIHGVRICRKMFSFLNCMSHFRYDNLVVISSNMACVPVHMETSNALLLTPFRSRK